MPETLQFHKTIERPNLVAPFVTKLLRDLYLKEQILAAKINPDYAGGQDFCSHSRDSLFLKWKKLQLSNRSKEK